ncbi:MAG: crossover junction endodeoxyribonuclease RuvC [Patescibacteria group bacterium]
MRILGVDPGLAKVGWGVIEQPTDKSPEQRKKEEWLVVEYGCISTSAKKSIAERLSKINQAITKLISQFEPTEAAIENLFFGVNAKTAMKVGEGKGVVILACGQCNIPVKEFTPLEIKTALTGYGRADKKQVQEMVKRFLNLEQLPQPDHAADALACAYCAGITRGQPEL